MELRETESGWSRLLKRAFLSLLWRKGPGSEGRKGQAGSEAARGNGTGRGGRLFAPRGDEGEESFGWERRKSQGGARPEGGSGLLVRPEPRGDSEDAGAGRTRAALGRRGAGELAGRLESGPEEDSKYLTDPTLHFLGTHLGQPSFIGLGYGLDGPERERLSQALGRLQEGESSWDACERAGLMEECARMTQRCLQLQSCLDKTEPPVPEQPPAVRGSLCRDGRCDPGESCETCPDDCGRCPVPETCGDGRCGLEETCLSCRGDCCPCGDGACTPGIENCANCTRDCGECVAHVGTTLPGPACGKNGCEDGESCATCPADCEECPGPTTVTTTDATTEPTTTTAPPVSCRVESGCTCIPFTSLCLRCSVEVCCRGGRNCRYRDLDCDGVSSCGG